MAISKNRTNVFQIYKDEAKKHKPLPPVFLADYLFAFDQDEPLEGVFVKRVTSTDDELDVYSDNTLYDMSDFGTAIISFKGVSHTFKTFDFSLK